MGLCMYVLKVPRQCMQVLKVVRLCRDAGRECRLSIMRASPISLFTLHVTSTCE